MGTSNPFLIDNKSVSNISSGKSYFLIRKLDIQVMNGIRALLWYVFHLQHIDIVDF